MPPRQKNVLLSLIVFGLMMACASVVAQTFLPSFDLNWYTVDHGGGMVIGTASPGMTFSLSGTVGQVDASGPMSGTASAGLFTFEGGYWAGVQVNHCPADVSPLGGNGVVNIDDLLLVIGGWGSSNPQLDIAPVSALGSGDGVVNIDDLLLVITSWGPCP